MTRTKELTGLRDLSFSKWLRESNPGANCFTANDLDFVLRNYKTKQIMIIETKCRRANVTDGQRFFYQDLNSILKAGCAATGWEYMGVHLVQFEKLGPNDGKVFFDGKEVSEDRLKEIIYKFKL